jgi:uncharacterized protein
MQRFVVGLSRLVRLAPVPVLIAALGLTGVFAALSTQIQTLTGNEGFAPDYPELEASEVLAERFGDTSQSVLQILVSQPGGNVISPEGLKAVDKVTASLENGEVADVLDDDHPGGAIVSYLDTARNAGTAAGSDVTSLDEQELSGLFTQARDLAPEEQASGHRWGLVRRTPA